MVNRSLALAVALAALGATSSSVFAQECYRSSILSPTPFMGNNGEIFKLADGSIWEVQHAYEYLYEYYPTVTVCPNRGLLLIGRKSLNVQLLSATSRPAAPRSRVPTAPNKREPVDSQPLTDDFAFFDSRGQAAAYFDVSDTVTIYLWPGEAVAYLHDDSVYGFNGSHLGWYHNGLIYDQEGGIVAAPASAFGEPPAPASAKALKGLKPLRGLKELRPLRPLFARSWSRLPAVVFFLRGTE